jgi:Heterokaryon incompatibility protein (HET)
MTSEVLNTFYEYCFNELPTRLIDVRTMELVGREDVMSHFENEAKSRVSKWMTLSEESLARDLQSTVKYAILSHRWLPKGEPTFKNVSQGDLPSGAGLEKLRAFCKKAREYGCTFAWSDTCCIDKRSSSELDEAIRSMFRWYRNATICIVYLAGSSDVEDLASDPWFTRGWTLQELIAPRWIKFFGKRWHPFSDEENDKRCDASHHSVMLHPISAAANVPSNAVGFFLPESYSAREVLSWASGRRTTRVEDIAYCLIGLLDISLSIAYGEGRRACFRLMQAIIQNTSDSSIFVWKGKPSIYCSALPATPRGYLCEAPKIRGRVGNTYGDTHFAMANGMLQINVLLLPMNGKGKSRESDNGPTVITLTDPEHAIEDVTVVFETFQPTEFHEYQTSNIALGILDYLNEGGQGMLQRNIRDPHTAILLTFYNNPVGWRRMRTDNIIEVCPCRKMKKVLTTLHLDKMSANLIEKTQNTRTV